MKVLAAVDLSKASLLALDTLCSLPGAAASKAVLLHVVDLDPYTAGGSIPGIMEFARARLAEEAARLVSCGLPEPVVRVEQGDAVLTIGRIAREEAADLIVMTSLGKGARTGRLFGSTAERVATGGTTPVLVERVAVSASDTCCRVSEAAPFERVLVAVDHEDAADGLVASAASLPGVRAVRIVHVVSDAGSEAAARTRLEALAATLPEDLERGATVRMGDPARSIVEAAAEWPATIVALRPCRHGLAHRAVFGSVARAVALHAPCSVLFVPTTE